MSRDTASEEASDEPRRVSGRAIKLPIAFHELSSKKIFHVVSKPNPLERHGVLLKF